MKTIELNGISNLKIILDRNYTPQDALEADEAYEKAHKQLDYLERYITAFNKALENKTEPPEWYEITMNPEKYPRGR